MSEERLQEMWEAACMLDAHFTQDGYTLDAPAEETNRLTRLIGEEIDEQQKTRERLREELRRELSDSERRPGR